MISVLRGAKNKGLLILFRFIIFTSWPQYMDIWEQGIWVFFSKQGIYLKPSKIQGIFVQKTVDFDVLS